MSKNVSLSIYHTIMQLLKRITNVVQRRYASASNNSILGHRCLHCYWITTIETTCFSTYSLRVLPVAEDAPAEDRDA